MEKWNDTGVAYPADVRLHELFERQVRNTPNAVAVVFNESSLTYGELDARANQLANYLLAMGVTPDSLVGVCAERSLEMVVALYGILKAGAAYVPIEPSNPAERLKFMIEDAAPRVLLTQSGLRDDLPLTAAQVVCLDSEWDSIARYGANAPRVNVQSHNLAYMIYTSGSTGRPKGALNEHRGICNRLFWMQDAYQLGIDDRVLQKTPFSFDVSVWEFFWPLLTGARLIVAEPEGHRDGAYLVDLIQKQTITTLHFVPSMLHAFLLTPNVERCRSLKRVICSGESLSYELQERFFAKLPGVELHNLYGPTEAAVDVTYWACRPHDPSRSVPIGKPIANIQLHILNPQLQPVPIGAAGELHIAGVGVGRGYHRQPELTAEKFIPSPWSRGNSNARLYKTGDLARYRTDGNIEYLGRMDHQVKIRGYRIELGEIEEALGTYPRVGERVVVATESASGDKRLVAYIVPSGTPPTNVELQNHLRRSLPDYMVPSSYVVLNRLPLTSNGKLDRRALPVPTSDRPELENAYVPPQTPEEHALTVIWGALLRLDRVGIHDKFFELGGHSLLAAMMFAEIEKTYGKIFPLATLIEAPTISQLAKLLVEEGAVPEWSCLVPIQPRGSNPTLFCVHGVGGNVFSFGDLLRHLGNDQPVYGLQAQGLDGRQPPHTDVRDMAACYVREIQRHQPHGPYFLSGLSFGGLVAYEMGRQLEAFGEKVGLVALFDTEPVHGPSLSKTKRLARSLTFQARRFWFHSSELLRTPRREFFIYLNRKTRTLKRRFDSRLWELGRSFAMKLTSDRESLPQVLRNVRESCWMAARYYTALPYGGRVTLFRASERSLHCGVDSSEGWLELAAGGVDVYDIPGEHLTIMLEPNVEILARALKVSIAAALMDDNSPAREARDQNSELIKIGA